MADPVSVGAIFAFLNSAFKLSEYAVKLYGVESENGVFVRMIQQVRHDLEETERLLYVPSVKKKLISTPGKLPWIKGTIISTKSALNEIGRWVERVRADKEGYGSVSWDNRVRWVFNDHDKLVNRRMELGTSHQALSTVLAYLAPLEQIDTPVDAAPPKYDDATFFDDFLSPRQKRRKARDMEKSFGAEKKDEGTFDEGMCQPTQAPSSVFFTSQPITVPSQSTSATQQTDGMISPRPLDPSSNWAFPQALSSAYPLPAFQPPTSQAPQFCEGPNTFVSGIRPQNTPSHHLTSSTLPLVSCQTSLQQFSATNFLGPIDPFELFAESDAQASSTRSRDVHPIVVKSFLDICHPMSLQNPPVPPKICQSSAQTDTMAEIIGDLSIHHPENHSSLAEIPKNGFIAQSPSTDSFRELLVAVPSWQEMPTSQSEMLGDVTNRHATWSSSATEVPAKPDYAVERSRNPPPQFGGDAHTSTYAEMPSHTISQVPQAHQQYPPSTTSWSTTQHQTQSQLQPRYQSQNQLYRPPIPTPVSHTSFLNPMGTAAPSPISWQEQHQQTDQTPVSPPTQEATTAQPAASAVEQGYSFSRSATLGEARRRNQKALLDLIGRGSYG